MTGAFNINNLPLQLSVNIVQFDLTCNSDKGNK